MNSRILMTIFLMGFATGTAVAAPNASFTARKIQGTTCLAPCAVHFDAIGQGALSATPYQTPETTDPEFSRPFHSLRFAWDFGDPGSGVWTSGAAAATTTPVSKNSDVGAIAGHVYEQPGTYTVTLTVTNPNGQVSTTTRPVVVGDRTTYFSAADTFCFANDGSNWSGCPLNCAIDDNCTVTSSLQSALTAGDNCSGASDCAAATTRQRRVLLRRGDRFQASNGVRMFEGATPGFVEAFGSGARPILDLNGALMESGDRWTYLDLSYRDCGNSCLFLTVNNDYTTFLRVDATDYPNACFDESNFWPPEAWDQYPVLHAFIDMDCTGTTAVSYGSWVSSNYALWMGGTFSYDPRGVGTAASIRSRHTQHYLFSHISFLNAANGHEHLQLRQDDGDNTRWPAVSSGSAAQMAGRFVILSDNSFEESAANYFYTVRTCVDNGCNCGEPSGCAAALSGNITPTHDFIFERNYHYWPDDTAASKAAIYEIQGGGMTIRNNVYDLQGGFTGGLSFVQVTGSPTAARSGSTPTGNVHVYNNTLYFNQSISSPFSFTSLRGTGTGCTQNCFSRNNLLVAPSFTGAVGNSSAFTASNNLLIRTPNPFATTVPARGSTRISNFRLGSGSAGAVDTGYSFSASSNRDVWVYDDAFGGCRGTSSTGAWDVGASEFGAALCEASSGGSSSTSLQPPTLLTPR